jgi:peptide/nickel transport system substrate-binding protein
VEWTVIPDSATASAALQSGEIDWWEQVNPDLIPVLRRTRGVTIEITNTLGYIGFSRFNHLHPPFDNPAIRRAVLHAVNQEDYVRAVTGNDPEAWRACQSMWPCGTPYGTTTGSEALAGPRDPERVRRMLREAGYKGEKVVIINPTDFPTIGPFGQILADALRRCGMNVELQEMDWGSLVQRRVSKEPVEKGGWSIFHTWWVGPDVATPATNAPMRGNGDKGWFGWSTDAKLEELRDAWFNSKSEEEQKKYAAEMQKRGWEVVPFVPTAQFIVPTAYRSNISGILISPIAFLWNVEKK